MSFFNRLFSGSITINILMILALVGAVLFGGIAALISGGVAIKAASALVAGVVLMLIIRLMTLIQALSVREGDTLDKIRSTPLSAAVFYGCVVLAAALVTGSAFGAAPSPAAWPQSDREPVITLIPDRAQASPAAIWPARFSACEIYRADIEAAVGRYWGVWQYPEAFAAQLYQESLCDPWAISPVGAAGLAQFMPATWRETAEALGLHATPHDDIAIEAGAFYMARQMGIWTSERPQLERWRLGLASYNAGAGNILDAQRQCDGARDWREIEVCLPGVTGRHAQETRTYVGRIERWWRMMAAGSVLTGAPGVPAGLEGEPAARGPV